MGFFSTMFNKVSSVATSILKSRADEYLGRLKLLEDVLKTRIHESVDHTDKLKPKEKEAVKKVVDEVFDDLENLFGSDDKEE
jgi:hypothetical protein